MRPDGYYDPQAVDKFALPTFIRQHGMDDVIELVKEGRDGLIYKRPEDLMLEYGRVIGEVRGRIGVAGGLFDGETLHVPMYRRHPDRQAVYHEDVARWLSLMVSKEDLPLLHKWIGYSLDFEGGPICAVSIAGPPAVGKKLFARGLQECIDTEQAARGQALTAEYNAVLRRTPWLVIDEGMPTLRRGAEPADVFRELVSGEDFITRNPYEAPVTVNNPMRIIMTANNLDVVHALTKSRDLSVEDQEALAQRILHFTAREEAATWLKSKGGRRFTDGWIRGDGGHRESDYVVAEHFMWLYEHRHDFGQPEERLLVQGNAQSEIIQQMRTQSGAAPRVVELILGLVGTNPANLGQQYKAGMAEVNGGPESGFYITADAIKRYHTDQMSTERMTITHKRAAMVLSSLSIKTEIVNPTLEALDGQQYRLRWWRLDLPALLDRALEYGIPCERLTRLVQKHHPDAPVLKRVNLS